MDRFSPSLLPEPKNLVFEPSADKLEGDHRTGVATPSSPVFSPRATHRQIAALLRHEILTGKRHPGSQLPSTAQLAADWKASDFTVYTALQSLVKEGLVERTRGAGSYVSDPATRFTSAAVYHSSDILATEGQAFGRRLHISLRDKLARMKVGVEVFIDSRPQARRGPLLPALAEALLNRRVQCVIAPSVGDVARAAILKLSVPLAFASGTAATMGPRRVLFDTEAFLREAVRRLAAQGCRTIGIVSNVVEMTDGTNISRTFHSVFRSAVRTEGLETREEWIRKPARNKDDLETLGYHEFKALWRQKEKPDGLVVFSDQVVRGAILAILDSGKETILPRTKFVFHRNAHLPFLCPFPVTWAISDEDLMAEELIRTIMRQFQGEKVTPVKIPYVFQRDRDS